MAFSRSVAYKVWISDITSSEYIKQEGFNPNYVELAGKQVSRVNLIATVVGKFLSDDGNYGALTLDDGTETIRIKAFGPDVIKIKNIEIGQLVRAVAKIKEYNEERYLAADFVSELKDPNWLIVQKLELAEPSEVIPQPEDEETKIKPEPKQEEIKELEREPKKKETKETAGELPDFIAIITKLDTDDGADMQSVIKESKLPEDEVKTHIVELLKQGEIYEPRKGKLKVL